MHSGGLPLRSELQSLRRRNTERKHQHYRQRHGLEVTWRASHITIIQQNHTERKLALKSFDLPHFLSQPTQEVIYLGGSITQVGDTQKLLEEICDCPGHGAGDVMEGGGHLPHNSFFCFCFFHENRESSCASPYGADGQWKWSYLRYSAVGGREGCGSFDLMELNFHGELLFQEMRWSYGKITPFCFWGWKHHHWAEPFTRYDLTILVFQNDSNRNKSLIFNQYMSIVIATYW